MSFSDNRKQIYSEFGIDFEFFYQLYTLNQVPLDRRRIMAETPIEKYYRNIRKLDENITLLEKSGKDEYNAKIARNYFIAMFGKNWKEKVKTGEEHVYKYYKNFKSVFDEATRK